jgi:hypothetical protein
MTLTDKQMEDLIIAPSLSAVSYQASHLIDSLRQIKEVDFPANALLIRDVFLALAEHFRDILDNLYDPSNPFLPRGGEDGIDRTIAVAANLQTLYSFVRFLKASSTKYTPAAIQTALDQLARLHFPSTNGEPVCMIRPQWKYNLTYVPIHLEVESILSLSVLDPDAPIDRSTDPADYEDLLETIWRNWRSSEIQKDPSRETELPDLAPRQLAILSFAGLDTPDSLFYPLLAHELGHFFDYSFYPNELHCERLIQEAAKITYDQVEELMQGEDVDRESVNEIWQEIESLRDICLREMLADFMALRMMGISFFFAQAEFLKTVSEQNEPTVMDEGYPGIRFRLCELYQYICLDKSESGVLEFLKKAASFDTGTRKEVGEILTQYLQKWNDHLQKSIVSPARKTTHIENTFSLIESAVRSSIVELRTVAERIIPDQRRAVLGETFFERIELLKNGRPPAVQDERETSFAEISSAAWAYQIVYGELREAKGINLESRRAEYTKTCRLVMTAIEAIP